MRGGGRVVSPKPLHPPNVVREPAAHDSHKTKEVKEYGDGALVQVLLPLVAPEDGGVPVGEFIGLPAYV